MLGSRDARPARARKGSVVSLRRARIDLGAIASNARTIEAACGGPFWADVSADAHGHGAAAVATAVAGAGVAGLVVSTLGEAMALREAGVTAPIVAWQHPPAEGFERAAAFDIVPAISTPTQLAAASATVPAVVLAAALGDSLIGCPLGDPANDWHDLVADAALRERGGGPHVDAVLARAATRTPRSRCDPGTAATNAARAAEARLALAAAADAGLACAEQGGGLLFGDSALVLSGEATGAVPVVGRALYGLSPFAEESASELGLTPAMTVLAQVITTKTVAAGEGVSYGYTYRTKTPSTLALIAIGYAHGIDRVAGNRCTVWLNGRAYPVAGRVAMDVLVADLGADTAQVGDEAVLFGQRADGHPTVEEWALSVGSTPDRVVTAIAPHVVRSYE